MISTAKLTRSIMNTFETTAQRSMQRIGMIWRTAIAAIAMILVTASTFAQQSPVWRWIGQPGANAYSSSSNGRYNEVQEWSIEDLGGGSFAILAQSSVVDSIVHRPVGADGFSYLRIDSIGTRHVRIRWYVNAHGTEYHDAKATVNISRLTTMLGLIPD